MGLPNPCAHAPPYSAVLLVYILGRTTGSEDDWAKNLPSHGLDIFLMVGPMVLTNKPGDRDLDVKKVPYTHLQAKRCKHFGEHYLSNSQVLS